MTATQERTALYRIRGEADLLLYIGITNSPAIRWNGHQLVAGVIGGSLLYSSLTVAALLVAGGGLGVLFMAYRRRRHDRRQAG